MVKRKEKLSFYFFAGRAPANSAFIEDVADSLKQMSFYKIVPFSFVFKTIIVFIDA